MNYTLTRDGFNLVITSQSIKKSIRAVYGSAEPVPKFAREKLKRLGVDPDDYFWFMGYPVRNTHKAECLRIAREATTAYEQSTEGLIAHRQNLQARISGSWDRADRIRNRNWERGDEVGGVVRNAGDTAADAAISELRKFDSEHPEIVQMIQEQKQADADRFAREN